MGHVDKGVHKLLLAHHPDMYKRTLHQILKKVERHAEQRLQNTDTLRIYRRNISSGDIHRGHGNAFGKQP